MNIEENIKTFKTKEFGNISLEFGYIDGLYVVAGLFDWDDDADFIFKITSEKQDLVKCYYNDLDQEHIDEMIEEWLDDEDKLNLTIAMSSKIGNSH